MENLSERKMEDPVLLTRESLDCSSVNHTYIILSDCKHSINLQYVNILKTGCAKKYFVGNVLKKLIFDYSFNKLSISILLQYVQLKNVKLV